MADQPATTVPVERMQQPAGGARLAALLAMMVLLAVVLLQVYRVRSADERVEDFAYTRDRAYLDLQIARELAEPTLAGPERFVDSTPMASTASSGWVVLLASLMRTTGLSTEGGRTAQEVALLPLGLNVIAAGVLVLLGGHLLRREVRSGVWMFLLLVGMGLCMPLPRVVMAGGEFVPHAITMLLAIWLGIAVVERDRPSFWLTVMAALVTVLNISLRLEAISALVGTVAWAFVRGRTGRKLWSVAAGAGLLVVVAMYLGQSGAPAVPNVVLLHGSMVFGEHWSVLPEHLLWFAWRNLENALLPWMLLLIGAGLLAAGRRQMHSPVPSQRERAGWLFVFVFVALAHLLFGQTDDGFGHTAYLVPIGFVAIGRTLAASDRCDRQRVEQLSSMPPGVNAETAGTEKVTAATARPQVGTRGGVLIGLLCLVPLGVVAVPEIRAFVTAPQAARDAAVRDRAAAAFVRRYFPVGPVAVNRPGSAVYETNAELVDLAGVISHPVALARWEDRYDRAFVADVVTGAEARLALISGSPVDVPLPEGWSEVGGWFREGTGPVSNSAVRVYATVPSARTEVGMALRIFSESPQPVPHMEYWFVERPDASPTTQASVAKSK